MSSEKPSFFFLRGSAEKYCYNFNKSSERCPEVFGKKNPEQVVSGKNDTGNNSTNEKLSKNGTFSILALKT